MSSRGLRNFNPGNIRHVPGTTWVGQAPEQTDPSFVQFTDAKYGIRAIARIMKSYERQGILTIHGAINRWAPNSENDTDAYVADVCQKCGVGPDTIVDWRAVMPTLVKAIIVHENGQCPYSDEEIIGGIELA